MNSSSLSSPAPKVVHINWAASSAVWPGASDRGGREPSLNEQPGGLGDLLPDATGLDSEDDNQRTLKRAARLNSGAHGFDSVHQGAALGDDAVGQVGVIHGRDSQTIPSSSLPSRQWTSPRPTDTQCS